MMGNKIKEEQNSKLLNIENISVGIYILQISVQETIYQTKIIKL